MKQLEYFDELTDSVCPTFCLSRTTLDASRFLASMATQSVDLLFNYAFSNNRIVLCTGMGATFEQAALHQVTFEVGEFQESTQTGWSVLAHGIASDVTALFRSNPELGSLHCPENMGTRRKKSTSLRLTSNGLAVDKSFTSTNSMQRSRRQK
jgi:hypothetical protein